MGIDGDLKSNGVEFFIPIKTTNDFFSKIKNYDEGQRKFELVKKLKTLVLESGHFLIMRFYINQCPKKIQNQEFQLILQLK
tara:strand:- start:4847 stop:5089 length:243 start_codon:yes stop_codon:yes gene_type:complete